jgi:chorismate dehydratase
MTNIITDQEQKIMTMEKIKISAVKYANTYPFLWGMRESGFDKTIILETDHPAQCAAKLISGKVDIGLVPVAALPLVKNYTITGDYCIGADGNVRTVMLLSNCPFAHIKTINLDYRSMSSVNLTKVLARHMWNREFKWVDTSEKFDFMHIGADEAVVLIGDQCFESASNYDFGMDLAGEWKKYTGLPFVFACWASNRKLDKGFVSEFNSALKLGVDNIPAVAAYFSQTGTISQPELEDYLNNNIDFPLDEHKIQGMNMFLELLSRT